MRIKKSEILDITIWILIGFYTLIGHWIWFGRGIQETLIIILCIIQIARRFTKKKGKEEIVFLSLVLIVYVFIVTLNGESTEYLSEDIKAIVSGISVYVYLFSFLHSNHNKCVTYIGSICKFLAIYMWANSFVIIGQYFIPYFLMNRAAIAAVVNNAYWDQLTGFIGINGTTRWNVLSCIVILYYIFNSSSRKEWIRTVAFIVLSLVISMMNSARAFIVMMPLFVITYYVLIKRKNVFTVFKYLAWVIGIIFAMIVVYYSVPFVKAYIDDLINDKLAIYTSGNFAYMVGANDDRAVAINYAMQSGGLFGNGLGSVPMQFSNAFVKYLGLNSASSFIYMIGWIGYIGYCVTLGIGTQCYMRKKSLFQGVCFIVVWLVVSYLLPVFSSIILMVGMAIIFIMFEEETYQDKRIRV